MLIAPESIMFVLLAIMTAILVIGILSVLPYAAYATGRMPKSGMLWCVSIFYLALMLSVGGNIGMEFGEHGGLIVQLSLLLMYVMGLTTGVLTNLIKKEIVSMTETS